ncbi:hypothetical protein [Lactiplantibacillus plantarum]|uniref:hypothetical protein n=1 Tax=Lactiplantibacillus plantarum TaxID=1590 RepID=UPI0005E33F9F|nr:hypothetical protein [Lactiplantibacillus plantarum]CDN29037.1 hypothetical protein predicted by Glimmer/Critica [Lactiplantibacillus plantarum]
MADITHGTWIKDGKAVDAVYQSDVKVYGRNLLKDTAGDSSPIMVTASGGSISGDTTVSTVDGVTKAIQTTGNGEFFYRFMAPVVDNLYGLIPGGTYSFSGQLVSSDGSVSIAMRSQDSTSSSGFSDLPKVILPASTDFQTFSIKFTVPSNATGFYFSIQEYNFSAGDSFSFKQLKLEAGDQTAFSIAPEDILN